MLFINPPYQQTVAGVAQTTVGPPMGLAYLAGALREAGEVVHVLDANALGLTPAATIREALGHAPQVVGLTATTPTIHLAHEIARGLRHGGFEGPIAVGGPHATALPERTLAEFSAFTVAVAGEAEPRIAAIVRLLRERGDPAQVDGIAWRDGTRILSRPLEGGSPDPDTLAPPARDLLPTSRYRCPDGKHATTVVATRGCPAPCTYCAVPAHFGRTLRRRDPVAVVAEIGEQVTAEGVRWVNFIDDTFTWDADWVAAICDAMDAYGLSGRIRWQCLTRVDRVNPEMLRRMRQAGCHRIEMGVECASAEGLRALRKKIDRPTTLQAFRWAREAGLETLAFAMLNVPGETLADIDDTSRLLRELDADWIQLSYCTPYPGTRLYEDAVREGRLRTSDWRRFRFLREPVLDNGVLTPEEVRRAHRKVLREFWLRPTPVARLARRLAKEPDARWTTVRAGLHGLARLVRDEA